MNKPRQTTGKRTGRATRVIATLAWLNLAFLLVAWALEQHVAERNWMTAVLTYMPQAPLVLPTALLVLLALFARRWYVFAPVVLAVGLALGYFLGLQVHQEVEPAGQPTVSLMTWNIHRGQAGLDAIVERIASAYPEIICLQEARDFGERDSLRQKLARELPEYCFVRWDMLVIGARLPLLAPREIPLLETGPRSEALAATIQVDNQPVTVICAHLVTANAPIEAAQRGTPLRSRFKKQLGLRQRQVDSLEQYVHTLAGPWVMAGDFNTPPRGLIWQRLATLGNDSFQQVGFGLGYTFPAELPVMTIDHVLASSEVRPLKARVLPTTSSDHLPVFVKLEIAR